MSLSFDPNSLAGTLIIPAREFKLHLWPRILSRGRSDCVGGNTLATIEDAHPYVELNEKEQRIRDEFLSVYEGLREKLSKHDLNSKIHELYLNSIMPELIIVSGNKDGKEIDLLKLACDQINIVTEQINSFAS